MRTDRVAFFKKFVSEPQKIGSFTPSSQSLTRKIVRDLPWNDLNSIVELGAGTGVFTRYIAARKKNGCCMVVVEQDNILREQLIRILFAFVYKVGLY